MSTQEEKLAAVTTAVNKYATVETGLEAIKMQIDGLNEAIAACHTLGIGRQGEFLRIRNTLEAARGKVADAVEKVIAAHEKCTTIAKREGCDVVLPANFAIDGGVTALDGGR